MDNKKRKNFFVCFSCNYQTNNRTDYGRHCNTKKHILNEAQKNKVWITEKTQKNALSFTCECGKVYKYQSGLCKHKLSCVFENNNNNNTNSITCELVNIENNENPENIESGELSDVDYKSMFFQLLDENKEFKTILINQQKQIGELIPKIGSNNTINNVNNVKQKLNVNIFLNEHCKDAVNIDDFVKNIEISLDNLDFTKNNGLVEGLSNAIIENMNKLSLYERPLHCTDLKRETLYIKDNDAWEKDSNKLKIKKAIKEVSTKQFNSIKKWTEENPDFVDKDDKQEYFAKVLSVLGKDPSTVDDKVIKKLCNNSNLKKLLDK